MRWWFVGSVGIWTYQSQVAAVAAVVGRSGRTLCSVDEVVLLECWQRALLEVQTIS